MYLLGLVVAFLLVLGQAFWKVGVQHVHLELTPQYVFSKQIWTLVFSPFILAGLVIYAVATLLYLGLLARYPYAAVQSLVVPLSLIMAYIIAKALFHERISLINLGGLVILLLGITLATRR